MFIMHALRGKIIIKTNESLDVDEFIEFKRFAVLIISRSRSMHEKVD